MTALFRSGKPKEPEPPDPPKERELTPEEQLLAEKARAAAAKREEERRAQTNDVSNFLDDILGTVDEEGEAGEAGTAEPAPGSASEDALESGASGPSGALPVEPEPEPPGASESPEPPAPFASGEGGSEVRSGADWVEPEQTFRAGVYDPHSPAAEAGRRTLSLPMAEAWSRIVAMGMPGDPGARPAFEPEPAEGSFARTLESLGRRRHRGGPALDFEPEESVAGQEPQSARRTIILPARLAHQDYSLEDLPDRPPEGLSVGDEALDRGSDAEPPLPEDRLDDTALSEALAAAEVASRRAPAAAEAPPAAPPPAQPVPAPAPEPQRQYSLDDLPPAPAGPGGPAADPSGRTDRSAQADGDRLAEEQLPALPSSTAPAAAAAGPGPGNLVTLERAVDRSVEPGRSAQPPSAADGAVPMAAAENAADLSVQQLAEMERYIENQVDPSDPTRQISRKAPERPGMTLGDLLASARRALAGLAVKTLKTADRLLAPYCLDCKRLLGIVGILLWAGLIAFIIKTWFMPAGE
ncbi:MAG TPA: hypothetical protein PK280_03245 [Planctomycetota bacterium]|nr:hypothetical protein [Planctomycetota bacterium]